MPVRVSIAEGTIAISPAKARSFGPDDESAVRPLLMPASVFGVIGRDEMLQPSARCGRSLTRVPRKSTGPAAFAP